MNKPDPKTNPCYYCTEETGRCPHCHGTCERWTDAQKLREIDKKKKHDFDKEHAYFMTEAQREITIKNQKKYNIHGIRRK